MNGNYLQDWLQIKWFYGGIAVERLNSCESNIVSGCVGLGCWNGGSLAIDCAAVGNSIETTVYGRSELD